MTTYYVSKNGSDSNNGLGPDASHSTNKPWLTVGKALGSTGIASGDTVYIAPGVYRQAVTVAMTSAIVETLVRGDPANAQGFKDGSGVRVEAGEVRLTSYTTNDRTDPGAVTATIVLAGRDYLTFEDLFIVGRQNGIDATSPTSQHITFRRCGIFSQATNAIGMANAALAVYDWLIEKCVLRASSNALSISIATSSTGADYDANVVVKDSLLFSQSTIAINVVASSALTFEGNGVHLRNCTVQGGTTCFSSNSASLSSTVANTIYNCLLMAGTSFGIAANAAGGLITENYNRILAGTARSNVSAGANSVSDNSYCTLFELGQSALWGMRPRSPFTPWNSDPILGFGNTSGTTEDMLGVPRPSGGASALAGVGALERPNTWGRETTTVRTGSNALTITGPGVQDFELPVDAASTTVSTYVRWDSTYTGTKPQLKVLVGSEAGVSDASTTATGSANAWEQLSLNFTPTRAGIVTVRVQSNDTNGAGKTYADDFAVT